MTTNDQLLTVPEVAARLGISTEGVRRRIAAGQLRAIKLGKHNSALVLALLELVAGGRMLVLHGSVPSVPAPGALSRSPGHLC